MNGAAGSNSSALKSLAKMHHALREVGNVVVLLNSYLKNPIGSDRYEIEKRPNPEFKRYHQLSRTERDPSAGRPLFRLCRWRITRLARSLPFHSRQRTR